MRGGPGEGPPRGSSDRLICLFEESVNRVQAVRNAFQATRTPTHVNGKMTRKRKLSVDGDGATRMHTHTHAHTNMHIHIC